MAGSTRGQVKLHVVKGDKVKVIAGKDKGLVGEVIAVHPASHKVTVQGVNIVKRHLRDTSAQPQGRSTTKGGIVSSEAPIHVSNVQLVVKDGEGNEVATRVGYDRVEVTKRRPDGSEYKAFRSVRIARKTGEEI
ncbi:50S ribosomal protein L24 [Microlunatus panaciterrae]|uniref:Large ribosomal subunit protein uL24 n=1 Tax=Microlunatus panaciterrae TaxID=400768 RepID=A0ABS2RKM6_9ACTN|nr:50S ribosomal protein L24 [Microlunatus panaciterrae]MBM7799560.1 large subunit ribosomal protein L24 [Microlunatus panaciterrae]